MSEKDFYPASTDARAAWLENLVKQLVDGGYATKYGISDETVAQLQADSTWYSAWATERHSIDAFTQAVTKYFNTIQGKDSSAEPPKQPALPSATMPDDVPPGIEKRVRDFAREVKGSTIYAPADGEALGIATPAGSLTDVSQMKPILTATTRAAYGVGVKFKKLGMDAVRFEYRHNGGAWLPAGVILSSPGEFFAAPQTPGASEQIEVRCIFMKGNVMVGQWSDIVLVFITP